MTALWIVITCAVVVAGLLVFAARFKKPGGVGSNRESDEYKIVMLDAENLAEEGIREAYEKDVLPELRKYVASPAEIVEDMNQETGSYKVSSQGVTYVIDAFPDHGESWGNATVALFDIVNRQLEGTPYRFYAIAGGEDLRGVFLTQDGYQAMVETTPRKQAWPYLPKAEKPWYGQPHDDPPPKRA